MVAAWFRITRFSLLFDEKTKFFTCLDSLPYGGLRKKNLKAPGQTRDDVTICAPIVCAVFIET